ncbi:MAG TPA: methyltransferase domain-containing protein [Thermoanaerobaculia bacterium]|nr:methyltransferase domain-containing protein [Thermoanaerobaculia bacterium]
MPIGITRALALLHRTFRHHPPAQRAHILGRFLSAPFLRTLDLVPAGARVLDIGAGHGLLARLVAEERGREVVAVEPDLRKTLLAYHHPRVRFVAGYADCIRGSFDAITIYDVLYRLDAAARDALLQRAGSLLRRGGTLILKELDPGAPLKAKWNRLQERIADLLGMTLGDYGENPTRAQMAEMLDRAGFITIQWKRVDFGYPHAHIVYTARKP